MKIIPLDDRILVEPEDKSGEQTYGDGEVKLVIPETNKVRPTLGIVAEVGPGKQLEDGTYAPLKVKAGDTILFGQYSGATIDRDGIELLFLRESDVMAIIEEDEDALDDALMGVAAAVN